MSNVHQLVKELATYEQQRKRLEEDLDNLELEFETNTAGAVDGIEYDELLATFQTSKKDLEVQLDRVYKHIDTLEEDIESSTNNSYGYADDEY